MGMNFSKQSYWGRSEGERVVVGDFYVVFSACLSLIFQK